MDETVTKSEELAEIFDSFFITMVNNLKTEYDIDTQTNISTHPDPVLRATETFKNHPSLLKIKELMADKSRLFTFRYNTTKEKT